MYLHEYLSTTSDTLDSKSYFTVSIVIYPSVCTFVKSAIVSVRSVMNTCTHGMAPWCINFGTYANTGWHAHFGT